MPPYTNHHHIMASYNKKISVHTRDDEFGQQALALKEVPTPSTNNSTETSRMSQISPRDVQTMQLGPSASSDSLRNLNSNSSMISIGSSRSVFVAVPPSATASTSAQHLGNHNHHLLPPSASTNKNETKVIGNGNGNGNENGNVGGVMAKWKNMVQSNEKAAQLKSGPVEYRFRPIVNNEEKELFPEIEKSQLSSRAKKRKHVPFSHIIIRRRNGHDDDDNRDDNDDDSCTTVSSLTYDPSEFDVEVLQSFAEKYQDTNIEAHKELLRETNELIDRISKHNLDIIEDTAQVLNKHQHRHQHQHQHRHQHQHQHQHQHGGNTFEDIDAEKLMDDTNKLLDDFDQEPPLPPDIAALVEEDECERERAREHKERTHQQQQQHQHQQQEGRSSTLLDDMDHDLALQVEESQPLPQDIAALAEDNDLSFDDLREEDDEQAVTAVQNTANTAAADDKGQNEISLLDKGANDNFFSDDEGLSLMSPSKNDSPCDIHGGIGEGDKTGFENDLAIPRLLHRREDENPVPETNGTGGFENLIDMLNPRMQQKANVSSMSGSVLGSRSIPGRLGIANRFEERGERTDNDSEQGGIANIVQRLDHGKETRESGLLEEDGDEEGSDSTFSPPLNEIFIPTIHQFSFGFNDNPVWKSARPMRSDANLGVASARVRTKSDNDSRIQHIIRRGKDKFLNRWNRGKKMQATE